MEERHLTCIQCPRGCQIVVQMKDKEILSVEGNSCKRGNIYAHKEVMYPMRTVTSTVVVSNGLRDRVSVKTRGDVPKEKIFEVMSVINHIVVKAPVHIGDQVATNVCNTGIDIVATSNIADA